MDLNSDIDHNVGEEVEDVDTAHGGQHVGICEQRL